MQQDQHGKNQFNATNQLDNFNQFNGDANPLDNATNWLDNNTNQMDLDNYSNQCNDAFMHSHDQNQVVLRNQGQAGYKTPSVAITKLHLPLANILKGKLVEVVVLLVVELAMASYALVNWINM